MAHDVFGRVVVDSGSSSNFRIRFSTKKEDEECGLIYYGYRYYDSKNGCWISRDPLWESGHITSSISLNKKYFKLTNWKSDNAETDLYVMCRNNPISQIDSDGRWVWTAAIAAAVEAAYIELNKCPSQFNCKEGCNSCCDAAGAVGAAAIQAGYATALATICAPLAATGPWSALACIAAFTAIDAAATYNLGQSIQSCHSACNQKKSTSPPACCKEK